LDHPTRSQRVALSPSGARIFSGVPFDAKKKSCNLIRKREAYAYEKKPGNKDLPLFLHKNVEVVSYLS